MNFDDFYYFLQNKLPGAQLLFVTLSGSHAYGTNNENSDKDYRGVYIQPLDDILSFNYTEQINDDKNDIVFYELRRFIELIYSSNPNIIELLSMPDDCVIYKNELFNIILNEKNKFLTKACKNTFLGYSIDQINKSKSLDKKMNWEKERVIRKTPIDFCYFHENEVSIPLTDYLNTKLLNQEQCGLSKMPHSRDTYSIFYDKKDTKIFHGISFEDSNSIRLSSIPKDLGEDIVFLGYISYNFDGYAQHCRDYKSYQTWIKERNIHRYTDTMNAGQKIDSKNILHCVRLLNMSEEISKGEGIKVRREDNEYLMKIRKGEVNLQEIIDECDKKIKVIEESFDNSNLPESIDKKLLDNILVKIRKKSYNI